MSENLKDIRARFLRWRSAWEGKGLKLNIGKTMMMVSGTENAFALSKIEPCGTCVKRLVSNTVCCTLCNKWMQGRCTKMKKVSCSFARHFVCRRCKDLGEGKKEPMEGVCEEIAIQPACIRWFFISKQNLLSAQTALICNIFCRYL